MVEKLHVRQVPDVVVLSIFFASFKMLWIDISCLWDATLKYDECFLHVTNESYLEQNSTLQEMNAFCTSCILLDHKSNSAD